MNATRYLIGAFLLVSAFFAAAAPAAAAEDRAEPLVFVAIGNRPPYHVREPGGAYTGYDVDIARALRRHLGRRIKFYVASEEDALRDLAEGRADAVIGLEPSKKYEKVMDFSSPILINKVRIFVHQDTGFVHTLKDLRGLRVGLNRDAEIKDFVQLLPGIKLIPQADTPSSLQELANHKITVYLGDEHETQYYIRLYGMSAVKTVGGALMLKRRSIAVRKGNQEFLYLLNDALDQIRRDFVLQDIYEHWFGVAESAGFFQRKFLVLLLVVLGIVATVLLVTLIWNQKLADAVTSRTQEVQSEREHFQNIFDHASDGIAIINPIDLKVLEANQAMEEITGFKKSELMALKLSDLDASDDRNFVSHVQKAAGAGGSTMFEARIRNKYGQSVDLLIHARSFPYKGKRMVEAMVRDITERKKIQEMKDTILQDVAHELKTPMSKMAMSIDLLERNLAKEERGEYAKFFDICHRSVRRLQSTIDGILNLSRLESQTMKMEAELFSVQDVLSTVIEELGMIAQRKGVHLVNNLPHEEYFMKGDMEMIRRLFVNVIHNAIKFTDKGSIAVSAVQDKYKLVKITVKDEGIGLEPADLKKIFSRFYQKTPTYEGCGIGLTISQKIVSLHNGVIWAESEGLGKGTAMNMMFPLYSNDPSEAGPDGREKARV